MALPALLVQLLLPLYFIYLVWRGREATRVAWRLSAAHAVVFVLFVFLVGRWDWVGYYLRFVFPILLLVAIVVAYPRARRLPLSSADRRARINAIGNFLVLLLFVVLLAFTVRGRFHGSEPVRLALPLRDGMYYVGQGGNSPLVNYHNTHRAQRFALDIVQLNALGTRASGVYPSDLERYVIFGAPVYSPCDGAMVRVVDGLPDLIPPASQRDQPAGNHVVIACGDVNVALAHLQNGSVTKRPPGAAISAAEMVGRVGNSGNTSEPHLHVHAERSVANDARDGEGVPILFDGTFAVRNSVFINR